MNESSKDSNTLKYTVPIYSPNMMNINSSLSKSSLKDVKNISKHQYIKSYNAQVNPSSIKYTGSYSSKRPKSAKSIGNNVNVSKYKRNENQGSIGPMFKSSAPSKVTVINNPALEFNRNMTSKHKYEFKPKKIKTTKADYLGSSYRKSNISSTHKKYSKKTRLSKKSINSSSRMNEQGSTLGGSNSSKFSPTASNPRSGIGKSTMNTKSYNSLMAVLTRNADMNNEQTLYSNSNSNNKLSKTKSRVGLSKPNESEQKQGQESLKRDLEEYLKHSRNTASRNYLTSGGKTAKTHASYMHSQKSYR